MKFTLPDVGIAIAIVILTRMDTITLSVLLVAIIGIKLISDYFIEEDSDI